MVVCSPQLGVHTVSGQGGAVFDYQILSHLARSSVRLQIVTPEALPCAPIDGAHIERVALSKGRYANWVFGSAVLRLYRHQGFDLLRVFSPRYVGMAAWAFHLRYPRVPVAVNHLHLDDDPIDLAMTRLCARYADVFITISEFSKSQLVNAVRARPERVCVVYPGVAEYYKPAPLDQRLVASAGLLGKRIVLFVGSLKARKNLAFLISLFPQVVQQVPEACLVVVGSGEEETCLKQQAIDLGIASAIHFAGFAPEEDKVRWLNACDVFVSPSRLEGFGMNVAEAMACRKPVVVSDAGSLPEVVEDGVTGYAISLEDETGFLTAIVRLLNDPSLSTQIGLAGEQRVRREFRWDRSAAKVKCIYEEALARRLV